MNETTVSACAPEPLPPPSVPADETVMVGSSSRFSDSIWDISPPKSYEGPAARSIKIDWASIESIRWRQAVKEVVWIRLNRRVGKVVTVKPQTARRLASNATRIAEFLTSLGASCPTQVTREAEFLLLTELDDQRAPGTVQVYLRAYALLWSLRHHLSLSLPREPFGGTPVRRLARLKRSAENETPDIPPQVMRPFLDGCLFLISTLADEAERLATRVLNPQERKEATSSKERQSALSSKERLTHWLRRRGKKGLGVPAHADPGGQLNVSQAKREAAIDVNAHRHKEWFREALEAHTAKYGLDRSGTELSSPSFKTSYRKKKSADLLAEWAEQWSDPIILCDNPSLTSRCRLPPDHPIRWVNIRWVADQASLSSPGLFSQDRDTAERLWAILEDIVGRVGLAAPPTGATLEGVDQGALAGLIRDANTELAMVRPTGCEGGVKIFPKTGATLGIPLTLEDMFLYLVAACYVVTAYLTGMRDSEVKAIGNGSITRRRSEDGVVDMYWIESRTFKGPSRPMSGEERKWVAIEPTIRAIELLERMAEAVSPEQVHELPLFKVLTKEHSIGGIENRHINRLRDFLSTNAGALGIDPIPEFDGEAWHFTTRQFRQTLAQHIAVQPFGIIAGAIQYGHLRTQTFERYAGSVYNSFNAEVARRQRARAAEALVDLFLENREGSSPSGPKSGEVLAWFEEVEAEIEAEFGGLTPTRAELRRLLQNQAIVIYPGIFNLCLFDPSKANCYTEATPVSERTAPRESFCDPAQCGNSLVTPSQLPIWQHQLAQVENNLAIPRLSPLQRHLFEDERQRILTVLNDAA